MADIERYIESGRNANTKKKTEQCIQLFRDYLAHRFVLLKPEDLDHDELNRNLCRFLMQLKRRDGSDYEPVAVRNMVGSIARYLLEKKYDANIMEHQDFRDMREVLKRKLKELKELGLGNQPRTAASLTEEELGSLWSSNVFNTSTPLGLLRVLFFYLSVNFGMRSGQEHRDLKMGDVQLRQDHNGREFLTYQERQTKTRTGADPKNTRKCVPQLWSQPTMGERDPVVVYKKYMDKRPETMLTPDSPFYLSVIYRRKYDDPDLHWFKGAPIGRNTLQTMMKKAASEAGISGKIVTNHSARKTMIQTLRNSGFKTESIMEKSGHKNVSSVLNYSVVTDEEQKKMTEALTACSHLPQDSADSRLCGLRTPDEQRRNQPPPGPTITYNGCTFVTPPPPTPPPACRMTLERVPETLNNLFDMFPHVFQ